MNPGLQFVGRGFELARLRRVIDPRTNGPRIAVIEGPAGVGKTRLAEEAAHTFTGRVIWMRAEQLDRELPFGAVDDLILAIRRPGGPGPTDASGPMLIEAIEAGVARLAAEMPLLLVAEDVQWADPASWRTLRTIARRARELGIGVVITLRTPFDGEARSVLGRMSTYGSEEIVLGDLSEDELQELVVSHLGATPGHETMNLLTRAGGNALFATEILRSIRSRPTTNEKPGGPSTSAPSETAEPGDSTPSGLRAAVLSRLIGLGPKERHLLVLASMLGSTFTVTDLAWVANRAVPDVIADLDVALRAGVVEADLHELRFSHALVADCIREDQPAAIRSALHRHIAEVLAAHSAPAIRVAEHYVLAAELGDAGLRTGSRGDADAANWLDHAATQLESTSLPTSVRLLERSVALTPDEQTTTTRSLRLAGLYLLSGRLREAEASCRLMLAATEAPLSPAQELTARETLGAVLAMLGPLHAQSAAAEFDAVIALAARPDATTNERMSLADAKAAKATVVIYAGMIDESIRLAEEALRDAAVSGSRTARSRAHEALALAAMANIDPVGARHHASEALAWFSPADGRWAMVVTPHLTASLIAVSSGRIDEAVAIAEDGRRICAASGHLLPQLYLLPCLAVFRLIGADLDAADAISRETNELMADWCPELASAVTHAIVGYVASLRGDLAEAESTVNRASQEMWGSGAQVAIADLVAWLIASVLETCGKRDEAFEFMRLVWSVIGAATGAVVMAADLVRLAVSTDLPFAHEVLGELERRAAMAPIARNTLVARRARAILENDHVALESVAEGFAELKSTLTVAWVLREAAYAAVARSHPSAEQLIRRSIRMFDEMNAPSASADLRALGRKIGLHLRPTRSRATTNLSEVESLVVKLAVEGLTNREIGEKLFISARTVESHLTKVYTKLGVKNRVQLSAAAGR